MNENEIPEHERHNVLSVYWQMLREIESRAEVTKNSLDMHLVRGGYDVLNRIGYTKSRPVWEGKS